MTTMTEQITRLLTDQTRLGAPEPTLLPWLARWITPPALPAVAKAATRVSPLSPRDGGWPVIADATASVLADRTSDPAVLSEMLDDLPPLAAYLTPAQYEQVDWEHIRPESAGYAVMAGFRVTDDLGELARQPLWPAALRTIALTRVPPLADLRSLASASGPGGVTETDEEMVYLLPFRFPRASAQEQTLQLRRVAAAIDSAVRDGRPWYAAALLARAAPYLDDPARGEIQAVIADLPAPWLNHLTSLATDRRDPWRSDEDELAQSHPATAALNEMAAAADPASLAGVCLDVARQIAERHGLTDRWEPDDEGWEPRPRLAEPFPGAVESFWLDADRQHLLALETATPARFVNVYVAEAGKDEPAHGRPLVPGRSYEVCCNIGPPDGRSLVDDESAGFPEELLPEAPLPLHAVLFVEGRMKAEATIELPAVGGSPWVRLPLPASEAPTIIQAELAIYYEIAVVMVYSLTLPVGGAEDRTAQAELQFRLSRSLTDLPKVAGRGMSVIVPPSGSAPAVYVNGLTFAPQEFAHNPAMLTDAAFAVRGKLYDAHFEVIGKGRKAGPVSRYQGGRAKSLASLTDDLRELARSGAEVYEQLFPGNQDIPRQLRMEAGAHNRPPVLQVVSLGRERLPISWAAIYDLPVDNEPGSYTPCRSIQEFGPGGIRRDIPPRCPYEEEHRDGDQWKLNVLCPWGFWGLSAIIEHPPSTELRDLEVRAGRTTGPPVILMGSDPALEPRLRRQHLEALKAEHGKALLEPQVENRASVMNAIRAAQMDIFYFYCHILDDQTRPGEQAPAIGLGAEQVTGKDISAWARSSRRVRHPLVVLNGCGSVEVGSGSLYNLVDPFITWFEACGLVGTEITIEQGLGGWAMELFLSALREQPVGAALRSVRWEMFRHGNLMGLAYTPYCLAGLTLVPQPEEAQW
jgi:hypothetical protein